MPGGGRSCLARRGSESRGLDEVYAVLVVLESGSNCAFVMEEVLRASRYVAVTLNKHVFARALWPWAKFYVTREIPIIQEHYSL